MADDAPDTVLERKAQAQRKALGVGSVSLPRALGRGLSIAADALWGLSLAATPSGQDSLSLDRALARIGGDCLLILLDNETGPCALAVIDRALVTGVIEAQTLGKVTQFPTDSRPFTPTDAAMMAPLLDAALPRFVSMLAGQPEMSHLSGYGFGALVEDAQTAGLALDADQYLVVAFDISLAQDTRTGRALFLFPEPPKNPDRDSAAKTGRHAGFLGLVPARMQAVLTRIHIPLDRARALRPGDVLPISLQAVSGASLVMSGGHVVATGKLGQMNGFRAIRIGDEATPFCRPEPVSAPTAMAEVPQHAETVAPQGGAALPPATDLSLDMALEDLASGLPAPLDLT
ncbi:flagellar motor switch protein FliM [Marivita geojedonensis]|uniref:flagellar motor switch protein FliM n=1 Tax=Marivita geojedonensis TaxID=1123756 RepID=UPI000A1EA7E9|nr:FliM/FliN family flagellar motor switch protein [Marivita geojedonensis]PRY74166.1 flagellar motor switch protein FliM [Marivita geojedonensis]